jgi:hypothetical protein
VNGVEGLHHLKENVLQFMNEMKSRTVDGYYRYSYRGDLYDESAHWNVGSSVFALKIYYTLGVEDDQAIEAAANYVKTFQHGNCWIYDDLIFRKSFLRNIWCSLRNRDLSSLWNQNYKRAETRQCCSALMLYDSLPGSIDVFVPEDEQGIDNFLSAMDWNHPWQAGSHFSHLMFFLTLALKTGRIEQKAFDYLTDYAIRWVNRLQHSEDGSWYSGDTDSREKINGAMKIISGLIAADKVSFDYPEKLIDLCLAAANDESACDNFNIIFVSNYAGKLLGRNYRQPQIENFALNRLNIFWKHYHSDRNGFSFYPHRANDIYYSAKITRGLKEPDMHGTVLFLWGISIIAQLLGIENELGFREFRA